MSGPDDFFAESAKKSDVAAVVAGLSEAHGHILLHSLGLTHGRIEYRNQFVTGEESTDYPDCMAMVEAGLMERRDFSALSGGDWLFLVTYAGKKAARAYKRAVRDALRGGK